MSGGRRGGGVVSVPKMKEANHRAPLSKVCLAGSGGGGRAGGVRGGYSPPTPANTCVVHPSARTHTHMHITHTHTHPAGSFTTTKLCARNAPLRHILKDFRPLLRPPPPHLHPTPLPIRRPSTPPPTNTTNLSSSPPLNYWLGVNGLFWLASRR